MSRRTKKLPETETPEKTPNPALDPFGYWAHKIKRFWKENFESLPDPEKQHKVNHDKNDKRP